jgi:predicted membrane-bound spermidine synthase
MTTSEHEINRSVRFWLLATAVIVGAVVMAIELLGARMLSVVFGGSLAVWAAMLAVALLSLAAGYALGGRTADRRPSPGTLFGVLLSAAILCGLCPYERGILDRFSGLLGLRAGALAASATLFFLPLCLMGFTGPFVIRLLTSDREHAGRTAGAVYALSTLGSVAGTLLTGLWIVPTFGTSAGFRIAAVVLGAAAAIGFALARARRGLAGLAVAILLLALPPPGPRVGRTYVAPDGDSVTILAVRDSAYGRLVVLAKGEHRLLLSDGIVQTGVPRGLPQMPKGQALRDRYFQELIPYAVPDPARCRALVIGLAGGMTASLLRRYDMEIDAVDIDSTVIELARMYFGFEGEAEAADGRRYIETRSGKYDVCVLDTYSGDVFPFHLCTREAFQAVARALRTDGLLVVNFIGSPAGDAFACMDKTLRSVFSNVQAIRGEDGWDVQTITLFAANRPIEFNRGWLRYAADFRGVDPIGDMIARLSLQAPSDRGFVLVDDRNPIDYLRAAESRRWRERTVEAVGRDACSM